MKNKRKSSFKDDSQLYEAPDKKYIQTAPPEEVDVDAVIECWKRKRMKNKTQDQTLNGQGCPFYRLSGSIGLQKIPDE